MSGKSLGLAACTAVVVGNMVGSGFYLSPAAVAPYGLLAIVMWAVMGVGAVCLGLTFARLAAIAPITGGPYAYTRIAYGDFAGFLVAWGYWISIWASLPAIALAFTGALVNVFPALHSEAIAMALTLGAIWAVVLVNLRGVHAAGVFSELTTYTKLLPFAAIALAGLFYVRAENLSQFNPSGEPLFTAAAALAPVTMFAYLGLESATVPAGEVRDAARTIPRSTILGISLAAALYVLGTVAVLGVMPRDALADSVAPFTDAARIMWGSWGAGAVAIAVILSSIGALNGWTLLMGQVPMAAARDGLFPMLFGHQSARGVPAIGILISAALATVLLAFEAAGSPGMRTLYGLIVSLSTMAAVIPYAFCALAVGLVAARRGGKHRIGPVEVIAFLFALFTIYGCGAQAVLYGLLLLLAGIPVFVWQRARSLASGRG
ncbi:MAG TPA: amino acid permease [Burkholderiales bacterium]|nr:amino acid permease [Burkholderiales bacterium]